MNTTSYFLFVQIRVSLNWFKSLQKTNLAFRKSVNPYKLWGVKYISYTGDMSRV